MAVDTRNQTQGTKDNRGIFMAVVILLIIAGLAYAAFHQPGGIGSAYNSGANTNATSGTTTGTAGTANRTTGTSTGTGTTGTTTNP
jgi:hypothetical protein